MEPCERLFIRKPFQGTDRRSIIGTLVRLWKGETGIFRIPKRTKALYDYPLIWEIMIMSMFFIEISVSNDRG